MGPLQILDDLLLAVDDDRHRIEIHHLSHLESNLFPLLVTERGFSLTRYLSNPIGRREKSECVFRGKGKRRFGKI